MRDKKEIAGGLKNDFAYYRIYAKYANVIHAFSYFK